MRRIAVFAIAVIVFFATLVSVSAATSASMVGTYATVSSDGSCQVSITAKIHLDQPVAGLTYPIPKQATSVTLNGSRVRTQQKNDSQLINLSGALGTIAGDFTITIGYSLKNVISRTDTGGYMMEVPLLSGFAYPVTALEFSVTLPGAPDAKPAFSSGYHQSNIEKDLTYDLSGVTISGASQKELKDHETLVMTLPVSEEMFPQKGIELPDLKIVTIAMGVCALLAASYWLIALRCAPPRRTHAPLPPVGCTAGSLRSVLTLEGADLTMMVFSWAQLGYLLIDLDRNDRVTLRKRMDMGNERSSFEQRCYQLLFAKRTIVDTAGPHYAALCDKCKAMAPPIQSYLRPRTGNPRLFRSFAAMVGLFGGISLGISLSAGAALQWLLVVILAALGTASCFAIHRWAYCLFLLDRRNLWTALLHCAVWILLSLIAGTPGVGIWVVFTQLLAGLMAAFGGRRTEAGRQAMSQALGLRRYLRGASRAQLLQLLEKDPDYFYSLAPYALALGVDRTFARRFGKLRLTPCPYLTIGSQSQMTPADWSVLMRRTVSIMNAGQIQHSPLRTFLRNVINNRIK